MKNSFLKIIKFLLVIFLSSNLYAENLEITSSKVTLDKKDSKMILKGNVKAIDENKNILEASEAKYLKKEDFLESIGFTKIITGNNYLFESKNVKFDNKNKTIKSNYKTKIIDPDGNIFLVDMFSYNSIENILFSKGNIELKTKNKTFLNLLKFILMRKRKK